MALKDIPKQFRVDSEDEVRLAVAKYFMELGFSEEELSLEDYFSISLGHGAVKVNSDKQNGKLSGFSDILITRNGKNLAIVETKAPNLRLTEADAEQAISYARLLRQIPPYAIVTNGSQTKAYDVIQFVEVETPTACVWHQNEQQYASIGQQERDDAARHLFRFSPEFVRAFFEAQMKLGMSELKGSASSGRYYAPELFVSRSEIEGWFAQWLESDVPAFAIVGDSGTGKTNSMCNLAEAASQQHLVLFYQALRLRENLVASVQDDLAWEFGTNKHISFFIDRFVELARSTDSQIIIFVDGLDEFPGDKRHLLNDLIALIQRMRGLPIKLCVSCKLFDWAEFVIDRGESFNQLALNTFPLRQSVQHSQSSGWPSAKGIGVHLDVFTEEERESAFLKYKEAFDLTGELEGDLYKECAFPLMLKFVAQAYQGGDLRLSWSFSNIEVFQKYLDNRLGRIGATRRSIARRILNTLAVISVEQGSRLVDVDALASKMQWTDDTRDIFYELCRHNFLRTGSSIAHEKVTFTFERIRAYIYTTMVKNWHESEITPAIQDIQSISDHPLGRETIEFYFTHIDRGQTELLTEIAIADFDLFIVLTSTLEFRSSISDIAPESQADVYSKRLNQFTIAHSRIKHAHFPELRKLIRPYSDSDTGVWATPGVSMMQLRACTEDYPQQVIRVLGELLPGAGVGPVYLGTNELANLLPQKFAWNLILEDLNNFFEHKNLYDGANPEMLQEQIWDTLLYYPMFWSAGHPESFRSHFQVLGYSESEDVRDILIADVLDRIPKYLSSKVMELQNESLSQQRKRDAVSSCKDILKLRELLISLSSLTPTLKQPRFRRRTLFETIRDESNSIAARQVVSELVDLVLAEYQPMIETNFPALADKFSFCSAVTHRPLLVETAIIPGDDRTSINYAILPTTVHLPSNPMIVISHSDWILQNIPMHSTSEGYFKHGFSFGTSELNVTINDVRIVEPKAIVYRTRLDLALPIRSQVHQLIGVEAETIFRADWPTYNWD